MKCAPRPARRKEAPRAPRPLPPLRPLHGEAPRAPHPFPPPPAPAWGSAACLAPRSRSSGPCMGKRRVPRTPSPPLRLLHGEAPRAPHPLPPLRPLHGEAPRPCALAAAGSPLFFSDTGPTFRRCARRAQPVSCTKEAFFDVPHRPGNRRCCLSDERAGLPHGLRAAGFPRHGRRALRVGAPVGNRVGGGHALLRVQDRRAKGVLRYVRRAVRAGAGAGLPAGHRGADRHRGAAFVAGHGAVPGPRRRLGRPVAGRAHGRPRPAPKRDPRDRAPKARPPRPRPKAPPPNPRPKAPTPNPRPKTPQPPRPASPGTPCWPPWS